jgi:hypothetical protein
MNDAEILCLIEKHEVRLVRRVGSNGWEWVAYNAVGIGTSPNLREAVLACIVQVEAKDLT